MNYKLVAIDCDNTLLDSSGNIPEENKKTIRDLRKKGVEFVIATGRNDILVADYIEELGIKAPVIGCNGASIRNLSTNEIYYLSDIAKPTLKQIFSYFNDNNVPFKAFSMQKGFSNSRQSVEKGIKLIVSSYTKKLKTDIKYEYTEDTDKLIKNEKIVKVVLVDNDPKMIRKHQEELKKISGTEICRSARNCLDICAEGVSKGSALKQYAASLNIKSEEIVAFGDSENDYKMLKYAGFSVAMQNGEDSLKKIADMVTSSNNECGVSKALKKIFNI